MYYYTAFGLNITSEILFPELAIRIATDDTDVSIEIGITPKALESGETANPLLWITPDHYLIRITGVANYYAENGNHIIVEPHPDSEFNYVRLLLLCNAMAAIIHQRKLIPLHASGIMTDLGVILIVGTAGAGKSTTITALSKKGYKIFNDDVCVLKLEKGKVFAIPSYPMLKLWENSFELLKLENKNEDHKLRSDINKYGVFFHDQFISKWQPVVKIFKIEKAEDATDVTIIKQKGIEAFISIGENTYRSEYVEPMKLNALHFNMVNHLLKQCEVYKITRPMEGDSVSSIIEIIEKEIQEEVQ